MESSEPVVKPENVNVHLEAIEESVSNVIQNVGEVSNVNGPKKTCDMSVKKEKNLNQYNVIGQIGQHAQRHVVKESR